MKALKIVPVLWIFFFRTFPGFCQDLTYYEKMIANAPTDQEAIIYMDSILMATFSADPAAFIQYSQDFIQQAQEMDRIEDAARMAMNLQRPLTNYGNDPFNAITIINSVLARKYRIQDSLLLGGLYLKRGRANTFIDLKKSIEDYTIAIESFSKSDTLHVADAYLFRGQAHSNTGQFILAGEDFTTAYTLYENAGAYDYMMYAQEGIINMFSKNGFFEKAKEERDQLIAKMKSLGLNSYLADEYYNQALDYNRMGERELEYETLLQAQASFIEGSSNRVTLTGIHSMFISYYCDHAQLDEAKKHVDLLEALREGFEGNQLAELHYLNGKAAYLKTIGEFKPAIELTRSRLRIAEEIGLEEEILSANFLLSDIYYELEDFKKSIDFQQAGLKIKDAVYSKSAANAMAYYQTLYETEKKEKELVEKNTSISLLEKDNQYFRRIISVGSVTFLLAFGLIILYRNQRHLKSNKLLQERFSQELLLSQENERRRISKNLHDGIGQELLVIKNMLNNTRDENTKKLVNHTIEEVRSISRNLHPFHLQEMGITKTIEYTLNQIDENTDLFISAEIDDIDGLFSKENEIHIYRIIQESMSNILKHANAKAVKVTVKKIGHQVLISIRDNGIGFDYSEKYQDEKSLGLKTLRERTKVLNGQMRIISKKINGTVLEFKLPI